MPEQFLHGVQVVELDSGPRPIRTVASSVIGIIGTAPGAQAAAAAVLQTGVVASNNALTWTAKVAGALGNDIAVILRDPVANSAALSVSVTGKVITVNLATNGSGVITTTAAQVITAIGANTAANDLVTVANTGASTGAGVVAALLQTYLADGVDEAFPLDTPVLISGTRGEAAKLGTTGTLPAALDAILDQVGAAVVVVRVAVGADAAATQVNVIGSVDSATGQYKGAQALLGAESALGVVPRILIAPGFTEAVTKVSTTITGAPVTSALVTVAERLRAIIVADGPNTNDADAIAYRSLFGSARVYVVDPGVKIVDSTGATVNDPASARVAGVIARTDNDLGFWNSPSNKEINGIVGTKRAVDFVLGDPNARANYLNSREVATIIRQDGYRLWGNRTCSSDPKWAFLPVRRTADLINDSILRAHLWAVDRAITKTYLDDVVASVNSYLSYLREVGAIIDGKCWVDKSLNTPEQIADGRVTFDFDFTPPYPAEKITFRSRLTNEYLSEIV
ncbi:MAG: hypothetical protein RLZZ127_1560 [Planctomycetota bacterium]|jgi:phage tail sheath protein FI